MPHSGEIWYFEQSLGAPLVRPLRRRYKLRALPRSSNGSIAAISLSGTHRVVCLADLGRSDLTTLRRLAGKQTQVRIIGIARNSAEGERAEGCFATLPLKAIPVQVQKLVDAAFANMELAQRERAARNELKRSEREMDKAGETRRRR